MKKYLVLVFVMLFGFTLTVAQAATYTEDFEAPFPSWESGWLGQNSNLRNFNGIGEGRGNNPDGLWLSDGINGSNSNIAFLPSFGSLIQDFSIDVTTFVTDALFQALDMSNNIIFSQSLLALSGALTDPGQYQHLAFTSSNGVSGFSITGSNVQGNTSIDNVVVKTGNGTNNVPEPASLALLGLGFASMRLVRRKAV
jgi:hypothetical protein